MGRRYWGLLACVSWATEKEPERAHLSMAQQFCPLKPPLLLLGVRPNLDWGWRLGIKEARPQILPIW